MYYWYTRFVHINVCTSFVRVVCTKVLFKRLRLTILIFKKQHISKLVWLCIQQETSSEVLTFQFARKLEYRLVCSLMSSVQGTMVTAITTV